MFLHSLLLCGLYTVEVTGRVFSGVSPAIMSSNISRQLREPYSSSPGGAGCRDEHAGQTVSCLTVAHKQRAMGADSILTEGQSLSQVSEVGSKAPLRASDSMSSLQ